MREILFRGKQEDNGEWVYGAYYHQTEFYGDDCDYHYIISSCDELEDNMMCFDGVIPETVGQYTGLTDKNGKKIFEGDILNCSSFSGINDFKNCAVKWCDLFLSFRSDKHSLFGDFGQDYEVIGNIYDNPELIESEDNK